MGVRARRRRAARTPARVLVALSLLASLTTIALVVGTPSPARAAVRSAIDRVSRGNPLVSGDNPSGDFQSNAFSDAISADGRFVAFVTTHAISDLDTNAGGADVYVKDLVLNRIDLISYFPDADGSGFSSLSPAISGDGRIVAFVTRVPYGLAGDDSPYFGGSQGIWYVDRGAPDPTTGGYPSVFCSQGLTPCMDDPRPASVSDTFGSAVDTSVPPIEGTTDTLDIAAVRPLDGSCESFCFEWVPRRPTISADGRQIAFEVDDGEEFGRNLIAIRDLERERTIVLGDIPEEITFGRLQPPPDGLAPGTFDYLVRPDISADGMHVVFSVILAGDWQAWIYDRAVTGPPDEPGSIRFNRVTSDEIVGFDEDGDEVGDPDRGTIEDTVSFSPTVNADGSVVAYAFAYESNPDDPAPIEPMERFAGLPPFALNIVVVDRDAAGEPIAPRVVSGVGPPTSRDYDGGLFSDNAYPVLSDDGRMLAFLSEAMHFADLSSPGVGGCPSISDLFNEIETNAAGRVQGPARPAAPRAPAGGIPLPCHVYAVDLALELENDFRPVLVDQDDSVDGDGRSEPPDMDRSGRLVSFTSDATNLVGPVEMFDGEVEFLDDVFVLEWTPLVTATRQVVMPSTVVGATVQGTVPIVFDTEDFGPWEFGELQILGPHEQDFAVDYSACEGEVFHRPVMIAAEPQPEFITDNCQVTVSFTPTATGLREADVFLRPRSMFFAARPAHVEVTGAASLPEAIGQTERVSERLPGIDIPTQLYGESRNPAISANGRFVAFELSQDVDPRDQNGAPDIYVRDRMTGALDVVSLRDWQEVVPNALVGNPPGPYNYDAGSYAPAISADGRYIAFHSRDPKTLEPAGQGMSDFDSNDVYLVDRGEPDGSGSFTGESTVTVVSAFEGRQAGADHEVPTISGDGTQVAWQCRWRFGMSEFLPCAFVEDQDDLRGQVFVRDFDPDGDGVFGPGASPPLLVRPPEAFNVDVPLPDDWDDQEPDVRDEWPFTDDAFEPSISADGNHIAFVLETDPLFVCDYYDDFCPEAPFSDLVWVYDRDPDGNGRRDETPGRGYRIVTTTEFTAFDVDGDELFPNRFPFVGVDAYSPSINGDGTSVAYELVISVEPNRFGFPYRVGQIAVADRVQENGSFTTTEIISVAGPLDEVGFFETDQEECLFQELDEYPLPTYVDNCVNFGDATSFEPEISDDGRYVVFSTVARNLHLDPEDEEYGWCGLPNESAELCDVLVVDRLAPGNAGAPQLVNVPHPMSPSPFPNLDAFEPDISGDGRYIAFASGADNLLPFEDCGSGCLEPTDTNEQFDVFVREWEPATTANRTQIVFPATDVGATSAPQAVELGTIQFGPDPILSVSIVGGNQSDFVLTATQNCLPGLSESPVAPVAPVPDYGIVHIEDDSQCVPNVAFRPTGTGLRSSTLVVRVGSAPASMFEPQVIVVQLSGVGGGNPDQPPTTPEFTVSTNVLDFGEQIVGTTSPQQTLTVTNTGSAPFTISSVVVLTGQPDPDTASDYQIVSTDCANRTLQPGESCQVTLTFTPQAPGERPAILRFDDGAPGNPHLVTLTGRAPQPSVASNPVVTFSGRAITVSGADWQPGTVVTLFSVDQARPAITFPEQVTAVVDENGRFVRSFPVFPRSIIGPRLLIAQGSIPAMQAQTQLLVALPTVNGPTFTERG